jgi:nucleoside-diphosphate-sugar epimerase
LTSDTVRFWCEQFGLPFAKFVIPNPFGPFEKPRFCHYLMQCWTSGRTATVATPAYVRDNIHVSLLARAYADFVGSVDIHATFRRLAPSGYVETQGAFAQRFAREIGSRLSLECPLELAVQTNFPEPLVRINTDIPDPAVLGWSETGAWDELANFYGETAPFPRHQEERPE